MRKYSYLLSLFVALALTIVFAESSRAADPNDFRKPNQWQRERTINDAINKSSVKVEAQKTYPVSTLDQNGKPIKQIRNAKATIKLGASTANVGKSLFKRAPAIAITNAVIAILGKSVDWILDEQNNRVQYIDPDFIPPSGYWKIGVTTGQTPEETYRAHLLNAGFKPEKIVNLQCTITVPLKTARCTITGAADNLSFFAETPEPDTPKYIPMPEVAQKVIDQAEDDSKPDIQAPAMQVMNDAALDALEAGLLDAQLDAASDIPQPDPQEITQAQYDNPNWPEDGTGSGTGPETPVDPETPTDPENPNPEPTPTEWPAFCDWATLACDYYNWAMGAWEPPEGENNEVDIQQPDIGDWQSKANASYVQFDGQCPADVTIPINYMGAATNLSISYQPFCHFASMIKPAVILGAWISAMLIISGGRAKES